MKSLPIFSFLFFLSFSAMAQFNWFRRPSLREINLNYNDSSINFYVNTLDPRWKPKQGLRYYWYSMEKINSNIGGFSGKLLQGQYTVYDNDNNMLTQGSFNNGLKDGTWNTWYSNGKLKFTCRWKNGIIKDGCLCFDQSGNIINTNHPVNAMKPVPKNKTDNTSDPTRWIRKLEFWKKGKDK